MHKAWVLYVILAWRAVPLAPEEQKTLLVEFTHLDECVSVSQQVHTQVAAANSMFWLKDNQCIPCNEVFKDGCPKLTVRHKGLPPPKAPK